MLEVAETTTTTQSEEIVRSQHPGELQNIQAAYRLDGKNDLKWSQLVRTVLKGKMEDQPSYGYRAETRRSPF